MNAPVLVALIAAVLALTATLAIRRRSVLGALIALQCGYLLVSYVARPMLLLLVQPVPRAGDGVADARLAAFGYATGLAPVLQNALIGVVIFAFASRVLLSRPLATRRIEATVIPLRAAWGLFAVGWLVRLAWLAARTNLLATFAALATVGAGALILIHLRRSQRRTQVLLIIVVGGSEFAWSMVAAAKAPTFALGLWLLILALSSPGRTRKMFIAIPTVAVGLLAVFSMVQQAKVAEGLFFESPSVAAAYPAPVRGMVAVVARFDLISAGTDAVLAGPGSWIGPIEATQRMWSALVPTHLQYDKADNAGSLWAIEVRGRSLPYSNTGVHLAEGPIAEGYVIGGVAGIGVETILLVLITAGTAALVISRSTFGTLLGIVMLTQPTLFERGLLGVAEAVGKGLQVSLIGAVAVWIIMAGRRPGLQSSAFEEVPDASPDAAMHGIGLRGAAQ